MFHTPGLPGICSGLRRGRERALRRGFRLSGEAQGLRALRIDASAQEFLQLGSVMGDEEICRQSVAQGGSGDELGGTQARADGVQPGTEGRPHLARVFDRQVL